MRFHKETIKKTPISSQIGQTPLVQGKNTLPPHEEDTLNFEEIKKEIDENSSSKDAREEKNCESCIEFKGQVDRLTRDLSATEKRFEAERRLRLELEQLVAQWGRTQDAREKVERSQSQIM